jgi:3-methyladenine DNA glycosylase/8-oxoguanine DNA glycosylase
MSSIIDNYGPPSIYDGTSTLTIRSKLNTVIHTICSQQVATAGAEAMFSAFEATVINEGGVGAIITPELVLDTVGYEGSATLFPTKRADIINSCVAFEETRASSKLSGAKLASIVGVCHAWEDSIRPAMEAEIMDEAEVRRLLTSINGVGDWTVDMLLLFRYKQPDIWPVGDLAFRKGLASAFDRNEFDVDWKKNEKAIIQFGESFRPYRSVVSYYLYKVYGDLKKEKKSAAKEEKKQTKPSKK